MKLTAIVLLTALPFPAAASSYIAMDKVVFIDEFAKL
jgi:hypothetical protein